MHVRHAICGIFDKKKTHTSTYPWRAFWPLIKFTLDVKKAACSFKVIADNCGHGNCPRAETMEVELEMEQDFGRYMYKLINVGF